MPTTIWTGSISFGLVTVPVKLTPAVKTRDVSFNQLEEGTGARIRLRRVSEQTGEEVTPDKIVKGYEIEKGRYVVVEKDELDSLRPKASHTIEIEDFVDLADIDPIYFDSPYYVLADEKAAKPYKLLVEAMTKLQKVAIGRVVIRAKERLVAIRPLDGMLCVETMHYADEIVARDKLEIPGDEVDVSERELAMATHSSERKIAFGRVPRRVPRRVLQLVDQKRRSGDRPPPEPEAPAKVSTSSPHSRPASTSGRDDGNGRSRRRRRDEGDGCGVPITVKAPRRARESQRSARRPSRRQESASKRSP